MPTITKLQIQKHDKERVSIFLDEEYAFSVSLLAASALRRGQELSAQEQTALQDEGQEHLAYQKAIRYLSRRPHSIAEVRIYLAGKDVQEAIVDAVIERLTARGYVDDLQFARFWVDNREQFRPRGRRALAYELRQKGVDEDIIDTVLETVQETESAWQALEKVMYRWTSLDEWEYRQKTMGYLSRRGFGYGVCREAADRAWLAVSQEQ